MDRRLITLKEAHEYTGFGMTKMREIANRPESNFTIRLGNKIFIDKELLDKYIDRCIKYQISI